MVLVETTVAGLRGVRELAVVLEFVLQRGELGYDRFAFGLDIFVCGLSDCFVDIIYSTRLQNLSISSGASIIDVHSQE